jgi:hypothetical protein
MSWFNDGYEPGFHQDPCDEPDFEEMISEPEGFRHEFRDGSVIILQEFNDPIIEGNGMARKVARHIEKYQLDTDEAIKYLLKCE